MITCPVCEYDGLTAKPYELWPPPAHLALSPPYERVLGRPSYEACPRCGFEFGRNNNPGTGVACSFENYREEWDASGRPWFDATLAPPSPARPRPGHGTVFVLRLSEGEWQGSWQDPEASDCDDVEGTKVEVLAWARSCPAARWVVYSHLREEYLDLPADDDFDVGLPPRRGRSFVSRPVETSTGGEGWFGRTATEGLEAAGFAWVHVARVGSEAEARAEVDAWRGTSRGAGLTGADVRIDGGYRTTSRTSICGLTYRPDPASGTASRRCTDALSSAKSGAPVKTRNHA